MTEAEMIEMVQECECDNCVAARDGRASPETNLKDEAYAAILAAAAPHAEKLIALRRDEGENVDDAEVEVIAGLMCLDAAASVGVAKGIGLQIWLQTAFDALTSETKRHARRKMVAH